MSDKKIEELIEENAKLKSELSSLKKVVNSKRFKTANKAANYFNQLFPVTSRRRRVVNSILNFSKKKNKAGLKKEEKKILKFINNKSEIIIICGTPFSTPLKQRSHHLAECLADLGVAVVYYELGEYQQAINIFNNLLAKFPENISVLMSTARCYENMHDNDKALEYLDKVVDIFPEDEEAHELIRKLS